MTQHDHMSFGVGRRTLYVKHLRDGRLHLGITNFPEGAEPTSESIQLLPEQQRALLKFLLSPLIDRP